MRRVAIGLNAVTLLQEIQKGNFRLKDPSAVPEKKATNVKAKEETKTFVCVS